MDGQIGRRQQDEGGLDALFVHIMRQRLARLLFKLRGQIIETDIDLLRDGLQGQRLPDMEVYIVHGVADDAGLAAHGMISDQQAVFAHHNMA